MEITTQQREELFTQVLHELGVPKIGLEVTEEQMISLLKISIKEYASQIQNWLIYNQWSGLAGLNVAEADVAKSFITKSLDYESRFTYAYSKIVGLQSNGPWELKKDYITLEENNQYYSIPKNRELNEILWITPPDITNAVIDPFFGGFSSNLGFDFGAFSQYYVSPAYDILARSTDRNLKTRLIRSELSYKVTAGPDGTKILHLLPVPGGRFDYGISRFNKHRVWYWYYDVNPENVDECLRQNQDIIRAPNDVPIETIDYSQLNEPSKFWVQKFFTAKTKYTIGFQRSKFSGKITVKDSEINMEYSSLLSDANNDIANLKKELDEFLNKMTDRAMLERKAEEAKNLNETLKFRPIKNPIRWA